MLKSFVMRLLAGSALVALGARAVSAHPSLAPHAHPHAHGEVLILGLGEALLAAASVVVISALAMIVRRRLIGARSERRRKS